MTARLIQRSAGGVREWRMPERVEEVEQTDERPTIRRVTFDVPDGFMVTVSLVPYTPDEPPVLTGSPFAPETA